MTEPSADDADLREWFWRCALNLQNAAIKWVPQIAHPCDADHFADDAMRRIDALAEKRVAAAVQAERERCARLCDQLRDRGLPEDVRRLGETIRAHADRPAPEGAAPTTDHVFDGGSFGGGDQGECIICGKDAYLHAPTDLARPRCSTPSQEDTSSVSGERWPDPTPEMLTEYAHLASRSLAREDAAMAALRDIQVRAQPDGLRTFDRAIDDLVWIDDECRRVLAAHSAATKPTEAQE